MTTTTYESDTVKCEICFENAYECPCVRYSVLCYVCDEVIAECECAYCDWCMTRQPDHGEKCDECGSDL